MTGPNGPPVRTLAYKVDLILPHYSGFVVFYPMLSVLEMGLGHTGGQMLLGNDVFSKCHFSRNGPSGTFCLAY